jgi:hypothetical protein
VRSIVNLFLVFLLLIFSVSVVSAQSINAQIPERSGDFPDLDHPGVRVRVFVHEPKDKDREKPMVGSSAICSPDDPSASVVGSTGWKLPSTNWTYKLNKASVPASVGGANLPTFVANGFNSWTSSISASAKPALVYGGLTSKTKNGYDGENIIAWGRTSGSALAVTYTRYYVSTGVVVDTIMNLKYAWTLNSCSPIAYDAADILTHEQGHWFGLNDEYAAGYVNNTMYGYGFKAETKKTTPTQGDISGINLIYQ